MTNYEAEPSGKLPEASRPDRGWSWLQDRLSREKEAELGNWIAGELLQLESDFSHFVTHDSLKRDLRKEFASSRRSHSDVEQAGSETE